MMRAEWIESATGLLFDSSIRILVVAAAVWLLQALLRTQASSVRHAVWTAVLAAMLLMPALRTISPAFELAVPLPEPLAAPAREWKIVAFEVALPPANPTRTETISVRVPVRTTLPPESPTAPSTSERSAWLPVLFLVYVAVALLLLARMFMGWWAARTLYAQSEKLHFQHAPVYESPHVSVPLTIGIRSPRIVLPPSWVEWPDDKLSAVLAHETAHIRRRDPLILFAARINTCLFWFHPLAWWLAREIEATAEHACDDAGARAVGTGRRYAEVLLDMAEAMRRASGRVRWHAVGVAGTGMLGRRINRVLRGDHMRKTPRARAAALVIGCALAVAAGVACHQQIAAAPLRPDPAIVARQQEQQARTAAYYAAQKMSLSEAAALQAKLRTETDVDAAQRLLTFYRWRDGHPLQWNDLIPRRRQFALATIERHPDHPVATTASGLLSARHDPEGHASAARLWRSLGEAPKASAKVARNAARFFQNSNLPLAVALMTRAEALDPDARDLKSSPAASGKDYWASQLGELYAVALTGRSYFGDAPVTVDAKFAAAIRERVQTSADPRLLYTVGSALLRVRHVNPDREALKAEGMSYLERAISIDPNMTTARWLLVNTRSAERYRLAHERHRVGAKLDDADRLVVLPWLAWEAYRHGERANVEKESARRDEQFRQAKAYAEDALTLADRMKSDPAYSMTLHSARMTLAQLSFTAGNRSRAIEYLLASADVPASDELAYTYVVAGPTILKPLLDAGERDSVVQYLERMAKINIMERERLLKSADAIRRGQMPDWYQYQVASAQ